MRSVGTSSFDAEGEGTVINFDGQAVIVTGAGRGLGRLYALELARRGAQVVVNDLGGKMTGGGADTRVANQVVDEIRTCGGTAVASHESVDSSEGGEAIVQTAIDAFGRVDAVVSNAGIYDVARFDELAADAWRAMLSVHLDGSFHVCQHAFRVMKEQRYGRFVLISSNAGAFGKSGAAHYAAAKMGIIGLTNALALEGARYGILANSVLPMGSSRMVDETVALDELPPSERAFFDALVPERVVPMVVFLASRACDVTHQNLSAAAGRFARVFVGLTPGWFAGSDGVPNAEDVAAHWDEITSLDDYSVPFGLFDEAAEIRARLGLV
jgi:NAD(P)-dependent dehydrogenase (short-subunit alcohol dehydrogenase family)